MSVDNIMFQIDDIGSESYDSLQMILEVTIQNLLKKTHISSDALEDTCCEVIQKWKEDND